MNLAFYVAQKSWGQAVILTHIKEKSMICTNKTSIEYKFIVKHSEERDWTKNVCSDPCQSVQIFYGFLTEDERNDQKGSMKIYFKSMVKIKQTVYDYSFLSFIAELGGYTGLLLGVSILDLTSLFNVFIERATKN